MQTLQEACHKHESTLQADSRQLFPFQQYLTIAGGRTVQATTWGAVICRIKSDIFLAYE